MNSAAQSGRSGRGKTFSPEDFLLGGVICLALAAAVSCRLLDARAADYFRIAAIPSNDRWTAAFGELGKPAALLWLLLLWASAAKRPRLIFAGLLALALVPFAVLPMKALVGRIRPDEIRAEVLQKPIYLRSYSCPSGDAAVAFAGATVAAAFLATGGAPWIPFLVAAIVGLTRVCLLRHYVSDVCAGAAVGVLCGYAALRIANSRLSRSPPLMCLCARAGRWWRPASGILALLLLLMDASKRGPITAHFLAVFWPVVAFVLVAAKGPSWLRWGARGALRAGPRACWAGAIVCAILGLFLCAALLYAPFVLHARAGLPGGSQGGAGSDGPWFLPGPVGAVAALAGFFWAAAALRRGRLETALARLVAAVILSLGLAWVLGIGQVGG